jgi:predicted transcriptional regulator
MSWKRGAYPEFTLEDAVAVLFMLQNPVGRKTVSEVLELGEGSVRTLLKKLAGISVITSAQRGHSLNEKGQKLLEEIMECFSEALSVGEVEGYPAYALVVRSPGEFKSIELRDEAIRFHAKGAMILVVKGGEAVFPEDGRPLRETMPELAERLKKLSLEEGDMVVVTWAESEADSMKSAYHVALFLKEYCIPEEIKSLVR